MNAIVKAPLDGELLTGTVDVVSAINVFRGSEHVSVPAGSTIEECVAACLARHKGARPASIVVTLGDENVPRDWWSRIRVKPGAFVVVRGAPAGDSLKTILLLVVSVIAMVAVPFLTPFIGAVWAGVVGAGIAIAGQFLVNALFPVRPAQLGKGQSQTYSISGGSNSADPFGPIPFMLGTNRVFPKLGARVYTEFVGTDQYLRMLFVWGYGPFESITDLKVGETPLSKFSDVQIETDLDYNSSSETITLFPSQVIEESLSIELTFEAGWQEKRTAADVTEISFDVSAPRGYFRLDDEGKKKSLPIKLESQYRKVGETNWKSLPTIDLNLQAKEPYRAGDRVAVPLGQYDFRIRNAYEFTGGPSKAINDLVWVALRGYRSDKPIAFGKSLAVTALRIKATGQLNGTLDAVNGIVAPRHQVYNGSTWALGASKNPADLFRYVLQGAFNAKPIPDGGLDLLSIQAFWSFCNARGYTFNMPRGDRTSAWDCLADICAAGRAFPGFKDGRWSVVFDNPDAPISGHFTPRNSRDFQGERAYQAPPHALRVRFINAEMGYKEDERIVYDDGYTSANATLYEGVEFPGITTAELAWKFGRYHIAQAKLRPETYSLIVAREHFRCTFGDRVRVQHYLPLFGMTSGRVKSVVGNEVTFDEPVTISPGSSFRVRFSRPGGDSFTRDIAAVIGESFTVTMTGTGTEPEEGDLFSFGKAGLETVTLRIKKIEPIDEAEARIYMVDDAPAIANADTGTIPAFASQVTLPADALDLAPFNFVAVGQIDVIGNSVNYSATLTWEARLDASGRLTIRDFAIEYRSVTAGDSGLWLPAIPVGPNSRGTTITGLSPGLWAFRVKTRFNDNAESPWASVPVDIASTAVPADVTNLRVSVNDNITTLSWDPVTTPGVTHYVIRFAPVLTGAVWSSAAQINDFVPINSATVPTFVGTYLVKAVDAGAGLESVTAASVSSNVSGLRGLNVVEQVDEDPLWDGVLTNAEVVADVLRLTQAGGVLDWPEISDITPGYWTTQFPWASGIYAPGYIDLGEVFTSRVSVRLDASGDNLNNVIGAWGPIGSISEIGGTNSDGWRVRYEERHTSEDPAGTPTWTDWQELQAGDYTFRAIDRRLVLLSLVPDVRPQVFEASFTIDMPDQFRAENDIEILSDGMRVNFDPAFRIFGGIGISNPDPSVRILISNADAEGFDVTAVDGSNAFVSGKTFSYNAKGAGARVVT